MLTLLVATLAISESWKADWITVPPPQSKMADARWIWAHAPGSPVPTTRNAADGTFWFRSEFSAPAAQSDAELRIAADNEAVVWINGSEVATSKDWSQLLSIDVTKHIKAGANQIVVRATNSKGNGIQNPGGILVSVLGDGWSAFSGPNWTSSANAEFSELMSTTDLGPMDTTPWSLRDIQLIPPLFGKTFKLEKAPKRAVLRATGLGDYELFLNGKRIGDDVLEQPWSQYDKVLYWKEFDVTKLLKSGVNTLHVQMGNSFWLVAHPGGNRYFKGDAMPDFSEGSPYLLRLEGSADVDGISKVFLKTDATWKRALGPVTFSHILAGEDFDARNNPGAHTNWQPVQVAKAPRAQVLKQDFPSIAAHEIFKPVKWIARGAGRWSIDFGQNASGMMRFRVRGKRGQTLVLRPSEVMTDKGEVQQLNLWGREVRCSYTLGSNKSEDHQWRFFYHGFRYLDVEGAVREGQPNPNGLPVLERIEMVHIRANNPIGGTFHSSNDLFNRVHNLVDWAMRSNMMHSMTDCPHREKMGWLECSYLLAPTFSYRYQSHAWLKKILADIQHAQQPDGLIPTVAPIYLVRPFTDDFAYTLEWGCAGVMLPWHLYKWYGDRKILATSFASMRAFTDHAASQSKGFIARAGLGDWYDYGHGQGPGPSRFTPQELSSTATLAMCAKTVRDAAEVLGKSADVNRYDELYSNIRQAFQSKFYDPVKHTVQNNGSPQAGIAMALEAGLIPEGDRNAALDTLMKDLGERDWQQTPGDIGHVYFVRALAKAGRSDVLERVYSRTGLGSYGGILAKGMTTLPETWDAITVGSNSLNHCMLGHIMEWFYGYVLGIRQAPDSIGWKCILIAPETRELRSATGSFRTPQGLVEVDWNVDKRTWVASVSIPKGTAAKVVCPFPGTSARVNGKTKRHTLIDGNRPAVDLKSGKHRVEFVIDSSR